MIHIHIPPLRERKEDIPLLVKHFIKKHMEANNKDGDDYLSSSLMKKLQGYSYPGNVRELENIIERMMVLGEEDIDTLPLKKQNENEGLFLKSSLSDSGLNLVHFVGNIEKNILLQALEKSGGEKKKAAHLLKLSPRSFRYRLRKYKLVG